MTALATTRLVLSELTLEDAFAVFEVRGDPETMVYWDWPADPDPDATKAIVAGMIGDASAGHAKYWTLRCRSDNTFVDCAT
jgi:RimJ/RimL family protein N-acetyltransferase